MGKFIGAGRHKIQLFVYYVECREDERHTDFPSKEASFILETMASFTNGAILTEI